MNPLLKISNQVEELMSIARSRISPAVWAILLFTAFTTNIFGGLFMSKETHAISSFICLILLMIRLFAKKSKEEINREKYLGLVVLILFGVAVLMTYSKITSLP